MPPKEGNNRAKDETKGSHAHGRVSEESKSHSGAQCHVKDGDKGTIVEGDIGVDDSISDRQVTEHMSRKAPVTNPIGRVSTDQSIAHTHPSEMFKSVAIVAFQHLSFPGDVLSGLVGVLWPAGDPGEVLRKLRVEAERTMGLLLFDHEFDFLKRQLDLVGSASQLYLMLLEGDNVDLIRGQWAMVNNIFNASAQDLLSFPWARLSWEFCPFIGIFAVLHMSLLRDARLYGLSWGMTAEDLQKHDEAAKVQREAYVDGLELLVEATRKRDWSDPPAFFDYKRTNIYNHWQVFNERQIPGCDDYLVLLRHLYPDVPTTNRRIDAFKDIHSYALGESSTWDFETDSNAFEGGVVGPTWSRPLTDPATILVMLKDDKVPRHIRTTWLLRAGADEEVRTPGPFQHPNNPRGLFSNTPFHNFGTDMGNGNSSRVMNFRDPPSEVNPFTLRAAKVRVAGGVPTSFEVIADSGEVTELWDSGIAGGVVWEVEYPGRWFSTVSGWSLNPAQDHHIGCIILGFTRDVIGTPAEVLRHLSVTACAGLPEELEKRMSGGDKEASKKAREEYWAYLRKLHKVE